MFAEARNRPLPYIGNAGITDRPHPSHTRRVQQVPEGFVGGVKEADRGFSVSGEVKHGVINVTLCLRADTDALSWHDAGFPRSA